MYEFASVCSCARLHVCPSVRVSVRRCVCLFCVYVGMHARMYVCMYAGVYLCRYVYMYLCMYIWVYRWNVCPSECMHGNMSARLSAGMYVCMQVWVCICICVCLCVLCMACCVPKYSSDDMRAVRPVDSNDTASRGAAPGAADRATTAETTATEAMAKMITRRCDAVRGGSSPHTHRTDSSICGICLLATRI